jgi:mono/diheme cytochrome c family protein
MFTGMLHTHTLCVMLFLVLYLIKTTMLVSGMSQTLDRFSAKTRLMEIIISVVFLLTGIYLAFNSGQIGSWFWVKLIVVATAIPLAIIAFKRKRKPLALLAMMFLVYSYGISETKSPFFRKNIQGEFEGLSGLQLGQEVYRVHCTGCHGEDGKRGLSGAGDLTQSTLSFDEQMAIIRQGRKSMMAYENILTDEQIRAVTEFVYRMKK